MYKSVTSERYKKHLGLPDDYKVDAVLCYGTLYEDRVVSALENVLLELDIKAEIKPIKNEFLRFAREVTVGDTTIWFMIGYGGAWISEYIHWACLFGSKKNILLGSCGGLKTGMQQGDFIIPESSYGEESSVRMYNRESSIQFADEKLSEEFKWNLEPMVKKIWRGPMVTCQAMIGETLEDVLDWSSQGYYAVEMEASTVFAVSSHFGVPAAASMYVGDNLIEGHHNINDEFAKEADMRRQNQKTQIKAALITLLDEV